MNDIDCQFEVLEPEYADAHVSAPQMLIFSRGLKELKVIVYFMENCAVSITGGIAKSALGKVKLQYTAESPSGAYTASVSLRKVGFTFSNAQGMVRNFEFNGKRT